MQTQKLALEISYTMYTISLKGADQPLNGCDLCRKIMPRVTIDWLNHSTAQLPKMSNLSPLQKSS